MDINTYVSHLNNGNNRNVAVTGLAGRIIRGTKSTDFLTLTDDPDRKLVMLMGPDGLAKLLGRSGYDQLVQIGYEPNYIVRKVNEGNQFKLVVFEEGGSIRLATWDNVIEAVSEVYPTIERDLYAQRHDLKACLFKDIDEKFKRLTSQTMAEVDKEGKNNPNFMTYDRLLGFVRGGKPLSLVEIRAFLYFTVHLRELFSGDGYTYDDKGTRGLMEYIVPNKRIDQLGKNAIININVQIPSTTGKGNTVTSKSSKQLPLPPHYAAINSTKWDYRADQIGLLKDAEVWRKQHDLKPVTTDRTKVHLLIIDAQKDFCFPEGTLYVGGRSGTGAIDDNRRLVEFIYRNLRNITTITPTLDTHFPYQIFFPSFWVDENGQELGIHTLVVEGDDGALWNMGLDGKVIHKNVKPNIAVTEQIVGRGSYVWVIDQCRHYVKELKNAGKYTLYLWPPHCILGSDGHALVGTINEAQMFHAYTRRSNTVAEVKGGNPLTENYSVLRPEVLTRADGKPSSAQKNTRFIKNLLDADAVVIGGQAASHCVKSTIEDLLSEIQAQDPALVKKVYVLRDCMSAVAVPDSKGGFVADFAPQAEEALRKFADAGMHVVNSTDPMEDWSGLRLA